MLLENLMTMTIYFFKILHQQYQARYVTHLTLGLSLGLHHISRRTLHA